MKPCKQCPFLKDSIPGYLGGFSAEQTQAVALSEHEFHCHHTRESGNEKECVGRLLFASNLSKQFKDKELEKLREIAKKQNPGFKSEILSFNFKEHHGK